MIGRYVLHNRVHDYMRLGWMWRSNINCFAVLMIWPCECPMIEPSLYD
jgi:hypothetical protein